MAVSSFVDSGVGAFASAGGGAFEDFGDGVSLCPVQCAGGKSRLVSDLAADDVQSSYKGEPVRVDVGGIGGFGHECPDGVVSEQQRPELLADQFWYFRSESVS